MYAKASKVLYYNIFLEVNPESSHCVEAKGLSQHPGLHYKVAFPMLPLSISQNVDAQSIPEELKFRSVAAYRKIS